VSSVVLILPGVNRLYLHSAVALADAGLLERAVTGLAWRPATLEGRALEYLLKPLLRGRTRDELGRRLVHGLDPAYFATTPAPDLLYIAARKLGLPFSWHLYEHLVARIDRKAARLLHGGVRAVMGWGSSTHHAFLAARPRDIGRILCMASPHDVHFDRVIAAEKRLHPELFPDGPRPARVERYLRVPDELAQLVIANSRFTARTVREAGYQTPVEVIPLGVDEVAPRPAVRDRPRFLFAGAVSPLKGAHHLLKAWDRLRPKDAELVLAGEWQLPDSWRSDRVTALGRIPRAEMDDWYAKCAALVLPTLGDGFASVVLEALAHGLPVITTDANGAAEVLDADTGRVLPAGDVDALTETLRALIADPPPPSAAARAVAARYTWGRYRRHLQSVLTRWL
jgi:glycosyltransferase involved in cell wall biosynthesis